MSELIKTSIETNGNKFIITVHTSDGLYRAVCSEFEYGSFANLFANEISESLAQHIFKPGNHYFDGWCGEYASWFWMIAHRGYGKYYWCDISTVFDKYYGDFPNRILESKTDILSGLLKQDNESLDIIMLFGIDETIISSWNEYKEKITHTIPLKLKTWGYILSQNSCLLVDNFLQTANFKATDVYWKVIQEINDIQWYIFQKL